MNLSAVTEGSSPDLHITQFDAVGIVNRIDTTLNLKGAGEDLWGSLSERMMNRPEGKCSGGVTLIYNVCSIRDTAVRFCLSFLYKSWCIIEAIMTRLFRLCTDWDRGTD